MKSVHNQKKKFLRKKKRKKSEAVVGFAPWNWVSDEFHPQFWILPYLQPSLTLLLIFFLKSKSCQNKTLANPVNWYPVSLRSQTRV
jgi:hypothetical protein